MARAEIKRLEAASAYGGSGGGGGGGGGSGGVGGNGVWRSPRLAVNAINASSGPIAIGGAIAIGGSGNSKIIAPALAVPSIYAANNGGGGGGSQRDGAVDADTDDDPDAGINSSSSMAA
jgi:hypothetical protein